MAGPHLTFPSRLSTPMAITNVAVVPMDEKRVLHAHTVVIDDGSITAIGPSAAMDTAGMSTVDGSGRYLLPGLADMHVHYWTPGDPALFLANGVTLVRNMAGAPFHLELQRQIQDGELPGPHIVTTSPIIDRMPPPLPTWRGADGPSAARCLPRQLAARGYEQIKVLNSLSLETLQAICDEASLAGLRVTGHCPDAATFEQAIEAGMSSFEHLTGIWRGHMRKGIDLPELSHLALEALEAVADGIDEDAIRRLAHDMALQDVWNCPTLVALRSIYEPQDEGLVHPRMQPIVRHVPQAAMSMWALLDPSARFPDGLPAYQRWRDAMKRRNEALMRIVRILHEEGAPLLAGTDTSVRFVVQGFSIHEELSNLVEAGLTPYEALRCATSEAARFLGQTGEWGTVAVGRRADLLLVRGNPLTEIGALQNLEAVLVNGFHLTRSDLDRLLEQQAGLDQLVDLSGGFLGTTTGSVGTADEGTWSERQGDNEVGRLSFSRRILPSGEWLIEERRVYEQGSIFDVGGVQRHSIKLHLKPDLTIREARLREESWVGETSAVLTLTDTGVYQLRRIDEDGHETEEDLGSQPLLPDPTLGNSVYAPLAGHAVQLDNDKGKLACHLSRGRAAVVVLRFDQPEPLPSPSVADGDRRIVVRREEDSTVWTYTFSMDGGVKSVVCGSRTFVPVT